MLIRPMSWGSTAKEGNNLNHVAHCTDASPKQILDEAGSQQSDQLHHEFALIAKYQASHRDALVNSKEGFSDDGSGNELDFHPVTIESQQRRLRKSVKKMILRKDPILARVHKYLLISD